MRPVTSELEAVVETVPIANVAPRYVVGIPPSDIDPDEDKMRVDVGGAIISRAYDPSAIG